MCRAASQALQVSSGTDGTSDAKRDEKARLRDDDRGRRQHSLRARPAGPVEAGHDGAELFDGVDVIGPQRIAALDRGPLDARECRLQSEHGPRVRRRVGPAGQGENAGQVGFIRGPDLYVPRIRADVVILIGQHRPALRQVERGPRAPPGVGRNHADERAAGADRLQVAGRGGEIAGVADRVDAIEHAPDRRDTECFEPRFVQQAGVEIGDLLRDGSPGPGRPAQFFDDGEKIGVDFVGQLDERGERRALGRDLRAGEPAAVDVAVEIVLRPDGAIEPVGVDSRPRGR